MGGRQIENCGWEGGGELCMGEKEVENCGWEVGGNCGWEGEKEKIVGREEGGTWSHVAGPKKAGVQGVCPGGSVAQRRTPKGQVAVAFALRGERATTGYEPSTRVCFLYTRNCFLDTLTSYPDTCVCLLKPPRQRSSLSPERESRCHVRPANNPLQGGGGTCPGSNW